MTKELFNPHLYNTIKFSIINFVKYFSDFADQSSLRPLEKLVQSRDDQHSQLPSSCFGVNSGSPIKTESALPHFTDKGLHSIKHF